jgi:hypothetical protein
LHVAWWVKWVITLSFPLQVLALPYLGVCWLIKRHGLKLER